MLADGPGRRPDLERVTSDGRTALAASCWRGEHACARLLLAAGAEVDHADADGRTALGPPRAPATPPPCACASSAGPTRSAEGRAPRSLLRGRGRRDVHASVRGGVAGGARRRARASWTPTCDPRAGDGERPRAAQPRRPGQRGPIETDAAHPRDVAGRGREGGARARKPPPRLARLGARRRTARAGQRAARGRARRGAARADRRAWRRRAASARRAREPRALPAQDDLSTMTSWTPKTPKRPIRRLMTRRLFDTRPSLHARRRSAARAARRARAGRVPRRPRAPRGTPSGGARSRSAARTSRRGRRGGARRRARRARVCHETERETLHHRARLLRALGALGDERDKALSPSEALLVARARRGLASPSARAKRARARNTERRSRTCRTRWPGSDERSARSRRRSSAEARAGNRASRASVRRGVAPPPRAAASFLDGSRSWTPRSDEADADDGRNGRGGTTQGHQAVLGREEAHARAGTVAQKKNRKEKYQFYKPRFFTYTPIVSMRNRARKRASRFVNGRISSFEHFFWRFSRTGESPTLGVPSDSRGHLVT